MPVTITIQELPASAMPRLGEIDRSEHIRTLYAYRDNQLIPRQVDIQVQGWPPGQVASIIAACEPELAAGGTLFGALDGDTLAGIAVLGNRWILGDQLQLVLLHVSSAYRRQGIAQRLFNAAAERARQNGAKAMYISATESESAVNFYLSQGCRVAEQVDPDLYALEPLDIHFVKPLPADPTTTPDS